MSGVGWVLTNHVSCFPVKNVREFVSGMIMYKRYDCNIGMSLYPMSKVMFFVHLFHTVIYGRP